MHKTSLIPFRVDSARMDYSFDPEVDGTFSLPAVPSFPGGPPGQPPGNQTLSSLRFVRYMIHDKQLSFKNKGD